MSFEACAFRYTGDDKDFVIEDPWGKDGHVCIGDGKPFLVPPLNREFYVSIKDFKEVNIPKGMIEEVVTKVLASGEYRSAAATDRNKNILFIAPDEGGYTGARYHAYQIALSLAKQGYAVNFVTPSHPIYEKDLGSHPNLKVEIEGSLVTNNTGFGMVIAAPPQGLSIGAAKAAEEGALYYPICFEPNEVLRKQFKNLEDDIWDDSPYYKSADGVIVNSERTKKQVCSLWKIPAEKVFVITPAINIAEIDAVPALENLGPSLVYIGRAVSFKGLYDTIDLLRLRGSDLPPFTFHVISREAEYVKRAKGEGTGKHPVVYHENISDYKKFAIIKGCTGGIQLSKHEGFGMVPAEFIACGKPVLCRPIAQIKHEYRDKVWYAETEDEICQFVNDLFNGKCVVSEDSVSAVQRYSMDNMQNDVLQILSNEYMVKKNRYKCRIEHTGRPRVLFATKYSYDEPIFGGAESTIKRHAEAMREFGFDIFYAFSLDNRPKLYRQGRCYQDDFAWRFEIPKQPLLRRGLEYESYLADVVDTVMPDVVMTYAEPIFFVGPVCQSRNIPYVISVNFWRCLTNRFDEPEKSQPEDLDEEGVSVIQNAAGIIANSEYTKRVVEQITGRKDVTIIHSPVSPDKVVATENIERDCIGITVCESGDARYVLNGIVNLLRDEKFLIGQFRGKEDVDDRIKSLPNVEYLDRFTDAKEFYRRVKLVLVISPSLSHSFCKTALEAMLNGIPVIASDKGNLPYLIGDGGVLVPVESDVSGWVDRIKSVLNDKDLYRELSENGVSRAPAFCDDKIYRENLKKVMVDPYVLAPDTITLECPNFPGVQASLRSIEAVVPGTKFVGSDFSNKNLSLISGWMNGYKKIVESKNAVMLDWHSPISQSELSGELGLLHEFMQYVDNHNVKKIFFRDEKTATALQEIYGGKIQWLPNVIDTNTIKQYADKPFNDGFHVSIFCPAHPRKNIMAQMIGAAIAGANLHINEWIASNQQYLNLIKQIHPGVVVENMENFTQLLKTKAKMHVGLEVTWSESFNYSLIEYLLLGVPVLAPATTPAFEEIVKDDLCRKWLVIENPGDPLEISEKLQNIKENGYILELKSRVDECIMRTAERRNAIAIKALRGGGNGS